MNASWVYYSVIVTVILALPSSGDRKERKYREKWLAVNRLKWGEEWREKVEESLSSVIDVGGKCACRCCSLTPSLYVVCTEDMIVHLSANQTCEAQDRMHVTTASPIFVRCTASLCYRRLKHKCRHPGYIVHRCLVSDRLGRDGGPASHAWWRQGLFSIWGRFIMMWIGLILLIIIALMKIKAFERRHSAYHTRQLVLLPAVELWQYENTAESSRRWTWHRWRRDHRTVEPLMLTVKTCTNCGADDGTRKTIGGMERDGCIPVKNVGEEKSSRARRKAVTFVDDDRLENEDENGGNSIHTSTAATSNPETLTPTEKPTCYRTFVKDVTRLDMKK